MDESGQRVLVASSLLVSSPDVNWREVVLLLPVLGGALSTLHLVIHGLVALFKRQTKSKVSILDGQVGTNRRVDPDSDSTTSRSYIDEIGGRGAFTFKILRAVVSTLLVIAVGTVQAFGRRSDRTITIGSENIDVVEKWGMLTIYVRFPFPISLL